MDGRIDELIISSLKKMQRKLKVQEGIKKLKEGFCSFSFRELCLLLILQAQKEDILLF